MSAVEDSTKVCMGTDSKQLQQDTVHADLHSVQQELKS